jgi:hypothetical protein
MSDTVCFNCGERWDWFYIRDEICYPDEDTDLYSSLSNHGGDAGGFSFTPGMYIERCPACPKGDGEFKRSENAAALAAIAAVLGDDVDGFMAEAEDLGLI